MDALHSGQPMGLGGAVTSQSVAPKTGKSNMGMAVVPLEKPRSFNLGKFCEDQTTQPPFKKTTLMSRITYPFKAAGQRLVNDMFMGGMIGGGISALAGGAIGGALDGGLGVCIAGLAKLIKGGDTKSMLKNGAVFGALVGAVIGGAVTGPPGAIVGALAFGVCSLVKGVVRFPFDIYHAFTSATPEMPVNLPKTLFRGTMKFAQEALDTITVLTSNKGSLADALKEMNLEAEGLDKTKLDRTFRRLSGKMHPDKNGGEGTEEFQRMEAAKEFLAKALELNTPLPRLVEIEKALTIRVEFEAD